MNRYFAMKTACFPRKWKVAWGNHGSDYGDNRSDKYFLTQKEAQDRADEMNEIQEMLDIKLRLTLPTVCDTISSRK